jgi:hypothetical protein
MSMNQLSQGFKFAGVTVDYYDDRGETLRGKFPTPDALPEMIKSANVQPKEELVNEDFALVMVDEGHVFRKFACVDPGTTAMSVVYFMEHGDKLPEAAQKLAAANLVQACLDHDIMPPAEMSKVAKISKGLQELAARKGHVFGGHAGNRYAAHHAGQTAARMRSKSGVDAGVRFAEGAGKQSRKASREALDKAANVVNVTGQRPEPRLVSNLPTDENDYAVKLADGSLHYPIDTWDRVKRAEAYWADHNHEMEPPIRRQYAVKLAQKSFILGYPLAEDIVQHGARSYHSAGHLRHAIEMRKVACAPDSHGREFLEELFTKHAEINPEVYAECLHQFDVMEGLDKGWDRIVLDPWASTFGVKTASEVVWEQGAERVTAEELHNMANNWSDDLEQQFSQDFVDAFQKDPVALFNSMPDPQKKILARMANDSSAYGGSEMAPTKAPEQAMTGHKKSLG